MYMPCAEVVDVARETVAAIIKLCNKDGDGTSFGMLCLFAYAFLLRVPSEALPVLAGGSGQSVLKREGKFLVLTLASRKNRPKGSRLERGCWCSECKDTCPLHVLGPYFAKFPVGARVFGEFNRNNALKKLREVMAGLNAPKASEYRTHDFRRGHAKDLQVSGMFLLIVVLFSFAICMDSHVFGRCPVVEDSGGRRVEIPSVPQVSRHAYAGQRFDDPNSCRRVR